MIYSKRGGFIKTRRFESDWTLMYGYTKTDGQSKLNTSKRSSFRWIDMDVSTFLYDVDKHRLTPSHTRRRHHRHVVAKLGWPRKGNFQATL